MTMQDRAYAVAMFIVFGICCIGIYVAVSGLLNANPNGLTIALLNQATETPTVGVTIEIPTETPAPPTNTPPPPTRTPRGFVPSPTPGFTRPPTLDFLPTVPTPEPFTPTPVPSPTPPGCGAEFCPRPGPPDPRAPGGNPCPPNLIWGFVLDRNGQGMVGIKVTFRDDHGNAGEKDTKGPPDPPGIYDFPVAGGIWTVQLAGRRDTTRSTPFQVAAGQVWTGSGNCPTRVDFIQQ